MNFKFVPPKSTSGPCLVRSGCQMNGARPSLCRTRGGLPRAYFTLASCAQIFLFIFFPVMDRPFIHSVSLPSTRDMGSAPAARKPASSVENESIL